MAASPARRRPRPLARAYATPTAHQPARPAMPAAPAVRVCLVLRDVRLQMTFVIGLDNAKSFLLLVRTRSRCDCTFSASGQFSGNTVVLIVRCAINSGRR